jgi:arylsulfatase
VTLWSEGARQPFRRGLQDDDGPAVGWSVQKGVLYLAHPTDPGQLERLPVIESSGAAADERRRSPHHAGLDPVAYSRWRGTIDDRNRACVLVPGGGSVGWELDLPAPTTLRIGLGMPPALDLAASGDAAAVIILDDSPVLTQELQTGQPWQDHSVALPAGPHELRLKVDPLGDPAHDAVCFAEPQLVPGDAAEAPPRRIVLVGIDTLRPDHLGIYGHSRPTSPVLDQLAQQSLTFDQTWAPAPRTRPSFRTMLTGRWPLAAQDSPTLAEQLRAAGFTTAGFAANVHLTDALGFTRGSGDWRYHDSADASDQVDRLLAWLQTHRAEDSFAFLHLMDPHVFYSAPPPYWGAFSQGVKETGVPRRFNRWTVLADMRKGKLTPPMQAEIEARYDEELRYLDAQLGRLVQALDALPGDTVLVLSSDHGEEFWEHGGYEHNHALYDELTRALFWVRPSGGLSERRAVQAPASLADVTPTLLAMVGVDAAASDGLDLSPLLGDPAPELQAAMGERALQLGHFMFEQEEWGVVADGHKYVLRTVDGREQLFALDSDPSEQTNLASRLDDAARGDWLQRLVAAAGGTGGLGWRIHLRDATLPFTLRFSSPVVDAGVIDPEAARTRRSNLEWGEVPPVLAADVATVELGPDRHTVTVTPGSRGAGVVWILGPGRETVAQVDQAGRRFEAQAGRRALGGGPAVITPGPLFLPALTEAAQLAKEPSPHTLRALRALGYVH